MFSQKLAINEVMFDVPGGDYHDEYVEIANVDTLEIDISGWQIGDQDELDALSFPETKYRILAPGEYLLILDGSYFDNSSTYDSLLEAGIHYCVIGDGSFGKSGFSNSVPEWVIIANSAGDTLDKYLYSIDNEPGFSDEKIISAGPNTKANWGNSTTFGGTPGGKNSIAKTGISLIISEFSIRQDEEYLHIKAGLFNASPNRDTVHIQYWQDIDFNAETEDMDRLLYTYSLPLEPYATVSREDSMLFNFPGNIQILLHLPDDPELLKHSLLYWRSDVREKIGINEFMFVPLAGEWEWIEMYNGQEEILSLRNYNIVINEDTLEIDIDAIISPSDYAVLSEEEGLPSRFAFANEKVFALSRWENIRSTRETILLLSPLNEVIDSLSFDSDWWRESHANRSFERKGTDLPNAIGNWGFCRNETGGTPGYVNSWLRADNPIDLGYLSINSEVFSPEIESLSAYLEVKIEAGSGGILDLFIFDLRGRLVTMLADKDQPLGYAYYLWDGRNDFNLEMPSGTYILYAKFDGPKRRWQIKKPVALLRLDK